MEPGQLCSVVATFIEDRGGRALLRLPNGSKTSVSYGSVTPQAARAHFIPAQDDSTVEVFCSDDDWSTVARDYNTAADELRAHTLEH